MKRASLLGRVTVDGNGHLYKTGGGELVLPAASVMQSQPLEIGVLGGVLTLQSDGTRPSVAEPAVIRDEAAFWLDVSSANLITTNGPRHSLCEILPRILCALGALSG